MRLLANEQVITESDILFFPFNAEEVEGVPDRLYAAEDWADYFRQFISDGVYPNPSTGLQVQSRYGSMVLTVGAGSSFIGGHFYLQRADVDFSVDAADLILARKDAVVCRLDRVNRLISVLYIKGTPASSPILPALQRNDDIWDLRLAEIHINANAQTLSNTNITDTRMNNAVCGIVHGVVNQVDTTTIYQQYYSWFNEAKAHNDAFIASSNTTFSGFMAGINTLFDNFMVDKNQQWTQMASAFAAWENTFQATARSEFNAFIAANQQAFDEWWAGIQAILNAEVVGVLTMRLIILEGDFGQWASRQGQDMTTVFNPDGSITKTAKNASTQAVIGSIVTSFPNGQIVEVLTVTGATKTLTKTTTFPPDGSIKEVIR